MRPLIKKKKRKFKIYSRNKEKKNFQHLKKKKWGTNKIIFNLFYTGVGQEYTCVLGKGKVAKWKRLESEVYPSILYIFLFVECCMHAFFFLI